LSRFRIPNDRRGEHLLDRETREHRVTCGCGQDPLPLARDPQEGSARDRLLHREIGVGGARGYSSIFPLTFRFPRLYSLDMKLELKRTLCTFSMCCRPARREESVARLIH